MALDPNSCYQAVVTHDRRFDGVFFVAVSTTMIYCRPICPARTPMQSRCRFFSHASAAEKAGYRPCLRCRPELAPGNAPVDAVQRLAGAICSRIDDGALNDSSVEILAQEFGVTSRHLRRITLAEHGVSIIELAQTQRLLLAKKLLAETDLSMADVALSSGFASVRRFNSLFKERYRLTPSELRRGEAPDANDVLTLQIHYRPPYDWTSFMRFIGNDVANGVDRVENGIYERTLLIQGYSGRISVTNNLAKYCLDVVISRTLAPVITHVITGVKRFFDTSSHAEKISADLGLLALDRPGVRVPGAFDGFEMASRAILGQQVSVKAAATLAGRFARRFGETMVTDKTYLNVASPKANVVANATLDDIASLGIVRTRANAILQLAKAVDSAVINLNPSHDPEAVIRELVKLPGIGEWTAHYIGMRALRWPDAFPHTDLAIYKALGTRVPKDVLRTAEVWRPWRAYAAMHLWHRFEEMAK